jgi:V8-like Glu-specific endopeptidase
MKQIDFEKCFKHNYKIVLLICFSLTAQSLSAKPAFIPYERMTYKVASGNQQAFGKEEILAFQKVITVPQAKWLRVMFGECSLGSRSYITITSLEDGGVQRLEADSLEQWRNRSAFFNGEAVRIELHVAPAEADISIRVEEIVYGREVDDDDVGVMDICGEDTRVPATDPAIGRFVFDNGTDQFAKCTAWITSIGLHLTAGHCAPLGSLGMPDLFEFNIPDSDANGIPNFADPDDQYPVNQATIVARDNDMGDDWAVFDCFANSNTDLLPVQAQGAFYRMSRDYIPANIRITGYGIDDGVRNRTLQTDWGTYLGESGTGSRVYHEYLADTQSGNSGGPIIAYGTSFSIGIHAQDGCDPPDDGNHGTSFENDDLENAIQAFFGTNVIYADAGHPVSPELEAGSVLRPYDTIPEALSAVPHNGIIRITSGSYTKADGNTFIAGADGKACTLMAPVGPVIIGN